uniref:Uncharacterized protein n=1 Tax=Arundo donax TaxID=35708 RepID=A0A0A8XZE3_ARUDO
MTKCTGSSAVMYRKSRKKTKNLKMQEHSSG